MSKGIIANLGFELELSGVSASKAVLRQERRFSHILRVVSGWEEAEVLTKSSDLQHVLAWGEGARARALAPRAATRWCDLEVVRTANDKAFSHHVAVELGVSLPGARLIASADEAFAAPGPWLVKHRFGVAGRGQTRVLGDTPETRARVAAMILDHAVLEPLIEVQEEFSGQFASDEQGVTLVGFTGLLTLPNGQFAGNTSVVEVPTAVSDAMGRAAQQVWALGYRGPFGIDGFRGLLSGREIVAPVSEINARWTFGRLTLELARLLGRPIRWHHPAQGAQRAPDAAPPTCEDRFRRLPEFCDPDGRSGTTIEAI